MADIVQTLYPYEGEHGFTFSAGEKIHVKERGEDGWWRGTLLKHGDLINGEIPGREGWFPSTYVESTEDLNTSVSNFLHASPLWINVS